MPTVPSDDALRAFLLGTLPVERAAEVQGWLAADPARVALLDRMTARDPLTDAVSGGANHTSVPAGVVERIARGVTGALRTPFADDTPSEAEHGGTVAQTRPPELAAATWPPERLGQFRIVRELGHGGMGYVFEAEDEKLGRHVAVKVLAPELAHRPDAAARFLREARAVAAVEHENVVPILHVGEDGVPYIVMPLLKGESLAERLKRDGKLPAADVTRIGRDAAAGLGAAHARGLVHRDVKPANVWLDPDGRARVLDFGLARQGDGADAVTDSRALVGTPAYMAPEQLDGHPATPQSDLFSLGATLYECATGVKAFEGPSITAILNAVNVCRPKPPTELNPDVPLALSALIERLLKRNPAERPTDARAVIAALVLRPAGSAGDSPSTVTWVDSEMRMKGRRRQKVWLVGGTIAAVVVLGVAVWQATRPPAPTVADTSPQPEPSAPKPDDTPNPSPYRGRVDVKVARTIDGREKLLRLNESGALPLQHNDPFVIDVEVEPAAYVYVVWVDPARDVTPVYPWNPALGWNTRPPKEEAVSKLTLPPNVKNRYRAPAAKPGVATMVMFARHTPLDVPDAEVEAWFKVLPEIELPKDGNSAAVWFENFAEVKEPNWLRTFGTIESNDPFTTWQGQLQKALVGKASFQTAVSFARTGRK